MRTEPNIGTMSRISRLILGICLLMLGYLYKQTWYGFFGILLLYSAATKWCPIYSLLGISLKKKG